MVWGFKNLPGMGGGIPPPLNKIRVKLPLTLKIGMIIDVGMVYLKTVQKFLKFSVVTSL